MMCVECAAVGEPRGLIAGVNRVGELHGRVDAWGVVETVHEEVHEEEGGVKRVKRLMLGGPCDMLSPPTHPKPRPDDDKKPFRRLFDEHLIC